MLKHKLLALEQVERWNFHLHLRRQSVAAHGHNVGIIAFILADALGLSDSECNQYAVWGLFHDFTESVTGDIPTLVKRHIKEWDKIEQEADRQAMKISTICAMNSTIPQITPMPLLVKLADSLDAWLYAQTEVELGNRAFLDIRNELNLSIKRTAFKVGSEYKSGIIGIGMLDILETLFAYDFAEADEKALPEGMSHV